MLLGRAMPAQWHASMLRRGHAPLMSEDEAATKMQAVAKGRATREELAAKQKGPGAPQGGPEGCTVS